LSTENESRNTRVALVTGAASGIGRATALRLARAGHAVLLADRDERGLAAACAEVEALGAVAATATLDVADAAACAEAVAAAARLGPLRALIHVAGVTAAPDGVETVSDADLERVLGVNVGAVFRLGRHAVPLLRAAGGGAIVTTSSVHAYASMTGNAAYAASKGALVALTRQMALDLAPDRIRVVGVAPGSVDTAMTRAELDRRGLTPETAGFTTTPGAIGRVMAADEIAAVIAWAASEDASALNGTTVVADAGLLARLV
jgi:NAD(P)-dependent dehydrogenase (short-subunit alcohol dehydrogenase family)